VLGIVLVITIVLAAASIGLGIFSLNYADKYEYNIERSCTVMEPRYTCSSHCTHGAVGDEQCSTYCTALVRVHPDDDATAHNRTTLEFSDTSSFYEYEANTKVTCYLNQYHQDIVSYEVHSETRKIVNVFAIGLGILAAVFIAVFVFGLGSTLIHGFLPHHHQFKRGDNHHEENDNASFL